MKVQEVFRMRFHRVKVDNSLYTNKVKKWRQNENTRNNQK